jgi:hypothetical protein
VVRELRENAEARDIPILIYTAADISGEERNQLESQVHAIASKSDQKGLLTMLSGLRDERKDERKAA